MTLPKDDKKRNIRTKNFYTLSDAQQPLRNQFTKHIFSGVQDRFN